MIAAAPPDTDLDALVHGPLDGVRLIEASAGTGKTWALCGLVVRLLLETPLTLPQILVVTFTKAAAAELRSRIRDRIASAAALIAGPGVSGSDAFVEPLLQRLQAEGATPDALASRLARALQAFDEASIFTIHGFCQRALAELPLSVGLAPAPTLLEDDTPLRRQVAQDFWRLRIAAMAGDDPSTLAFGALLLRRQDSPESWAERLRERLRQPLAELRWPVDLPVDPVALLAGAPAAWSALADAHRAVTALWRAERAALIARATDALPRLPGNVYSSARLAEAIDGADQLLDLPWTALAAGAVPAGLARLGSARLVVRKGEVPLSPHPFDAALQALLDLAGSAADDLARARLALLREFLVGAPAALQRLKQSERVAGFDDLLLDLHRGLSGPDSAGRTGLAAALRSRYPAALIDEFQDTDPLQYTIFQQLYGDGRSPVALVGDPKQAIYSFRSADLPTYLRARAQATTRATLRDNQRSTRALLNGLNGLFTRHARPFMEDGLDYTPVRFGSKPRARLGGANGDLVAPALQLWTLPGSAEGGGWLHLAPARRAVAQACAGEIARCLDDGRQGRLMLDGRPFAGGDVAVLVRTHAQGREMRRALAALGVASIELSQASVFASLDAEAAELVLAAVLEPNRLGAVRAALATDWYGWTAAEIEALADAPDAWSGPLLRFAEHHARWRRRGVAPMLRRLVRDDGVMARLLARPDGERRMTDLLHLVECLQEASATQGSPQALWRWLQAQRAQPPADEARQLRLESDRHLVQVVTVHKSKGLEYPVVFCPFLWDSARPPAGAGPRSYHDDDGRQVLDYRPVEKNDGVGSRLELERAAESLRLIYVALTRAVHRCVLVVGTHVQGRAEGTPTVSGRSVLNWLAAGAGHTPAEWLAGGAAPAVVAAAWQAFAAAHAPDVAIAPLPGPGDALAGHSPPPESIIALPGPASLPAVSWRIGSYSALMRGTPLTAAEASDPAAARDHDLHIDATALPADGAAGSAADPAAPPAADDILRFPRGPQAGECLHALFEHADFADPGSWPAAIAGALQQRPPRARADAVADAADAADDPDAWPRQMRRLLQAVTTTALPGGLQLDRVSAGERLNELEFHLPVARLTAAGLASRLNAHGYAAAPLTFLPLQGFLRGFIDLVFEQDGRFHLVDWKSNHLGSHAADYAGAGVDHALRRGGYELQALLYAVALHRHLTHRLSGYAYERHFGRLMVLFVRGVRPDWPGAGVWSHRPTAAAVHALSALFDDDAAPPPSPSAAPTR